MTSGQYVFERMLAVAEVDAALITLPSEEQAQAFLDELVLRDQWRFMLFTGRNGDLVRAFLCMRLNHLEEPERHLRTGIEWTEREGREVGAACCFQALAELEECRGRHAEALQDLDQTGELFSAYGARPYLDQVIAKKEIRKA